ncbi:MAG TPA: hypothetical protein VFZ21_23980, partial [Gemmatimonadaceae bacterium]|nr:hypothetical protein [Gemmatimonadaceae bacterium]
AMLDEPSLHSAGLGYLFKTWDRWAVNARERWRFYLSENLTDTAGFKERLAKLVERGEWPSMEAAEAEMRRVRPWCRRTPKFPHV